MVDISMTKGGTVKTRVVSLLAMLTVSLVISGPAFAHHSMSMYDSSRETTFKATITQFNWANPHTQIEFTVADEHGNIEKWVSEGPSPNRLANGGWTKESLKPGDQVTIVGNCNKNGSPTMRFVRVILPNGQELQARRHYY
jgi:Family of unknown function (DUF6152)